MIKITRKTIRETEIEYRGRKLIVQVLPRYLAIWRRARRRRTARSAYPGMSPTNSD